MAEIFLTYDVRKTTDSVHSELKKKQLIEHYGYQSTVLASDAKKYTLPNTTLRKEGVTTNECANEFKQACSDVGATWEKFIAIERATWTVNNNPPPL